MGSCPAPAFPSLSLPNPRMGLEGRGGGEPQAPRRALRTHRNQSEPPELERGRTHGTQGWASGQRVLDPALAQAPRGGAGPRTDLYVVSLDSDPLLSAPKLLLARL